MDGSSLRSNARGVCLLPVLHLDPMLGPASLIRPVTRRLNADTSLVDQVSHESPGEAHHRMAAVTEGIFVAPFEQGEIGPDLFRKAREFGLEGWSQSIAIDHIALAGRKSGFKNKNRKHPAMNRVMDAEVSGHSR
jgi:hypothetical protein